MINILVTGGAGYLGSIVVPDLLSKGYKVTVLDNFMYRQSGLAHLCTNKNLHIIRGDVRDEGLINKLIREHDVIFPLAALVGAPICAQDPYNAESVNHDSILNLFKNVHESQIIIMPTTNSAYGTGDENNFCTEESKLRPISKYAIDKVKIEEKLLEHENSISFRLATVFGMSPRMRIDLLVNDFVYRAVNDRAVVLFESSFKRNYIHIRDVSRVFLHGLENISKMKGQIYNVGLSEANLSKLELCKRIKEKVTEFEIIEAKIGKDPDQRNYIVSNEKIESTGYLPVHSLEEGIEELIKGYQMIKVSEYKNV
ncbi:NAD-dependent epimerase/dehydratase [Prochlorococcus sp. MIT 1223]|uniref:NAD-dependent epimerase/dehydratase family protein n=1 Tax=Prochlorococcus sp. MIT 1223 TaxID=3096217 RepID=UPI002A766416|nr:NAD-dependent epimerase/dehydratase [Prochlorococcus sp. MIT 1223]